MEKDELMKIFKKSALESLDIGHTHTHTHTHTKKMFVCMSYVCMFCVQNKKSALESLYIGDTHTHT